MAGARRATGKCVLAVAAVILVVFPVGCGGRSITGPSGRDSSVRPAQTTAVQAPAAAPATATAAPFVQQSFKDNHTIHFSASDPPNNALLAAPPARVTVAFSSDLGSGSFISVTIDGREVTTGSMILPIDNRSVSVNVSPAAGTGNYLVRYTPYWRDGSYTEGSFGFSVKLP